MLPFSDMEWRVIRPGCKLMQAPQRTSEKDGSRRRRLIVLGRPWLRPRGPYGRGCRSARDGFRWNSRYQFFLDYGYDANSYRLSSEVQFWTTVNEACMASPAGIANRNRFPPAVTSHAALGGGLKRATGVSA